MKNPRTIVVKTLLNPDEFLEFSEQCQAEDVPQSKKLRDLARGWLAERNGKARQQRQEWSAHGQVPAMLLPGRAGRPLIRMRV